MSNDADSTRGPVIAKAVYVFHSHRRLDLYFPPHSQLEIYTIPYVIWKVYVNIYASYFSLIESIRIEIEYDCPVSSEHP